MPNTTRTKLPGKKRGEATPAELRLATKARNAGIDYEEWRTKRTAFVTSYGRSREWRPSEIALALVDVERAAAAAYDREVPE